jgi:signal transduction histidine kinase
MNQIFKPFYTSKPSGLGPGLSLVRRIVERHHGDMTLSSTEHRGTTVTFRFLSTQK